MSLAAYARAVTRTRRRPVKHEQAEQEAVKTLLLAIGAKFWVAGTKRKHGDYQGSMQTPGLADLPLVFLPRHQRAGLTRDESLARGYPEHAYELVVIEMKSPGAARSKTGGLSPEQRDLQHYCELSGTPYIHGDANAVIAWLIQHGYLRKEQVPHYRIGS